MFDRALLEEFAAEGDGSGERLGLSTSS